MLFLICLDANFSKNGLLYQPIDDTSVYVAGKTENEEISDLIIPKIVEDNGNKQYTVTKILKGAFNQSQSIRKIVLPDSIQEIESFSFADSSLTGELVLPNSICKIGSFAFARTQIIGINLSTSLTVLEEGIFQLCEHLSGDIVCHHSLTKIENLCFFQTGITSFSAKNTLISSVGDYCFANCVMLKEITLSKLIINISKMMCIYCKSLSGILQIPDSVVYIGQGAFAGTGITSIVFGENLKIIDDFAFLECSQLSGKLNFGTCYGLKKIGSSCFASTGINEFHLSDADIEVGSMAFRNCNMLETVRLFNNLNFFGKDLFWQCSNLKTLEIYDYSYKKITIPERFCFQCDNLKSVKIIIWGPYNISKEAFAECFSLESVEFSYGISSIGLSAFYLCRKLTINLDFKYFKELIAIGPRAFQHCDSLYGELRLPNSLVFIGAYSFCGCKFIGSLQIPNSVEEIDEYAFFGCTFTGSLSIGTNVTRIGNCAFSSCSQFSGTLSMDPNGLLEEIGDSAFFMCSKFSGHLVIPNRVKVIGYAAFEGCTNLYGELELSKSLIEIGDFAFADCKLLSGILTIPPSVAEIGANAFTGCVGFTEVHFGNRSIIIRPKAFSRMHNKCFLNVPKGFNKSYFDSDNFDGAIVKEWMGFNMNCNTFNFIDPFLVVLISVISAAAGAGIFGFLWNLISAKSKEYELAKDAIKGIIEDAKEKELENYQKVEMASERIRQRIGLELKEPNCFLSKKDVKSIVKDLIQSDWTALVPSERKSLVENSVDGLNFKKWYQRIKCSKCCCSYCPYRCCRCCRCCKKEEKNESSNIGMENLVSTI